MKEYDQTLRSLFSQRSKFSHNDIPEDLRKHIQTVADASESSKGVFTVLITLLIYKIHHPGQDIRYHQHSLKGGFSGRSIDTQYITPTLKSLSLPHAQESGWLTRSLEQPHPYDKNYPGKIQNTELKSSFLHIIDLVQNENQKPDIIIGYLLSRIRVDSPKIKTINNPDILIDDILSILKKHFNKKYDTHGGSKLPVLALYTIYEILISELEKYKGLNLAPLRSHTASDKSSKAYGDIEIRDQNNHTIEALDIKLNRDIKDTMIKDLRNKIYKSKIRRYLLLSDGNKPDKKTVKEITEEINKNHGCQVIVNGVLPTMKYYLRLISSPGKFLENYSKKVQEDMELQRIHKTSLQSILEEYQKSF